MKNQKIELTQSMHVNFKDSQNFNQFDENLCFSLMFLAFRSMMEIISCAVRFFMQKQACTQRPCDFSRKRHLLMYLKFKF